MHKSNRGCMSVEGSREEGRVGCTRKDKGGKKSDSVYKQREVA